MGTTMGFHETGNSTGAEKQRLFFIFCFESHVGTAVWINTILWAAVDRFTTTRIIWGLST